MKRPRKELMEEILLLRKIVNLGMLAFHGNTREIQQNAAHDFESQAVDYLLKLRDRFDDDETE